MAEDIGFVISGGAGPYEAAVVAAVIRESLAQEERRRSRRPTDRRPAAWVRAGAPTPFANFVPPVVPDPGRNWPG